MAYNLADRFPKLPKYYPLLDPGTYEKKVPTKVKGNVAPFLSKSPRITQIPLKIWTHTIYSSDLPHRIPNCSAMMSKLPRFTYEGLREKFSSELICECDDPDKCECTSEEKKKIEKNESTRHQRIMIGSPPRSNINRVPCTNNKDHKLLGEKNEQCNPKENRNARLDNNINRIRQLIALYKESKHSKSTVKIVHEYPGPATYNLTKEPTQSYICAEKVRAYKRKTSKQYRFIELVQKKNIRDNLPGPASYNPQYPKYAELQFLGPKAERFAYAKGNDNPGPDNYNIKRDFDVPSLLDNRCHVTWPVRAAFGAKAPRLKSIRHEGPGPDSYDINYKSCMLTHCPMAPFGTNSLRFRDIEVEEEILDEEDFSAPKINTECKKSGENWMFKSHTIRMPPLKKKPNEQSPADMPPKKFEMKRSEQLQNAAPFGTSKVRFQPWYNWISVHDGGNRPGPGEYKPEKVSCVPAVLHGPLYRCKRFKPVVSHVPPPNEYKVTRGLETILRTHNKRLNENINKKHEFHWKGLKSTNRLNDKERESHLINCCLTLLNTDMFTAKKICSEKEVFCQKKDKGKNNKMLRCFLHKSSIPTYY